MCLNDISYITAVIINVSTSSISAVLDVSYWVSFNSKMTVLGKLTFTFASGKTQSKTSSNQKKCLTEIETLLYIVIYYFLPIYVAAFLSHSFSFSLFSPLIVIISISKFQYILCPSPYLAHLATLALKVSTPTLGVLMESALVTGSGLQQREGVLH